MSRATSPQIRAQRAICQGKLLPVADALERHAKYLGELAQGEVEALETHTARLAQMAQANADAGRAFFDEVFIPYGKTVYEWLNAVRWLKGNSQAALAADLERIRAEIFDTLRREWDGELFDCRNERQRLKAREISRVLEGASSEIRRIVEVLSGGGSGSPGRNWREEVNIRARDAIRGKPPEGKKRWTIRTFAKAIGCSTGLISELPAWRAYMEEHPRKTKKPTLPRVVSLTPAVLANEGREDAELQRLIAEQRGDDEGNPLGPARKQPRRRRQL